MPSWLLVLVGVAAIVALFASTGPGQRLRRRLPIRAIQQGRAPREDRDYLSRVCGGDAAQVERLLDLERRKNPELSEAQAYRRAIRSHLRDRS